MADTVGASRGSTAWRHAGTAAYVGSRDRAVVLDLDHLDRPPYVFEGTAAQIWSCLDGERNEAEVVAYLVGAFSAPAGQVADDVRGFLARLDELGLVTISDDSP